MLEKISNVLTTIDDFVWGIPLIVLILAVGIYLTIRLKGLQITKMPMAKSRTRLKKCWYMPLAFASRAGRPRFLDTTVGALECAYNVVHVVV